MKQVVSLLALVLMCNAALAAVVGKEVDYKAGDTPLKGYIAWDDAIKGKRPAVLVVHEWWGLNDYAQMRARMLAEMGYTAMAVDMYGNGKQATHPDDAGKFASEAPKSLPVAEARFKAAMKLLQQEKSVDPKHIAAIGYCFGGGIVLEMLRRGVKLDGVASKLGQGPELIARFHGQDTAIQDPGHRVARVNSQQPFEVTIGEEDRFCVIVRALIVTKVPQLEQDERVGGLGLQTTLQSGKPVAKVSAAEAVTRLQIPRTKAANHLFMPFMEPGSDAATAPPSYAALLL